MGPKVGAAPWSIEDLMGDPPTISGGRNRGTGGDTQTVVQVFEEEASGEGVSHCCAELKRDRNHLLAVDGAF